MDFDELAFHHHLARPGTIIDVGANKGSMTRHFAAWERYKTIAFEPFPPSHDELVSNIANGFDGSIPDRVTLRREALGASPGRARMRIPRSRGNVIDEWASLAKSFEGLEGVEFDEVEVPVTTIDAFALVDVTGIKLDAEGYEQEVLIGARRTLLACRPIVSIECEERHRDGCTHYIPGFMEALGFDGYWHDSRERNFRPITSLDRATMQQASASPIEHKYSEIYIHAFFFVPRENYELHLRLEQFGPILAT